MNSKHSVKLKSTPKKGLRSTSRNMNDSQATPTTSGTNEDEKSFKETVKKILSERNEGESLFDIIRNIVREEIKIYESNIKELINSNVNKTTERLDKLSAEIVDLTASLEFTQKKIDEELFQVKKEIKNLKTEVKAIEDDLLNADEVSAKLVELEDRSRRNNLRIDGIKEEPNETWEACEKNPKIADKLGIDSDIKIERCH